MTKSKASSSSPGWSLPISAGRTLAARPKFPCQIRPSSVLSIPGFQRQAVALGQHFDVLLHRDEEAHDLAPRRVRELRDFGNDLRFALGCSTSFVARGQRGCRGAAVSLCIRGRCCSTVSVPGVFFLAGFCPAFTLRLSSLLGRMSDSLTKAGRSFKPPPARPLVSKAKDGG